MPSPYIGNIAGIPESQIRKMLGLPVEDPTPLELAAQVGGGPHVTPTEPVPAFMGNQGQPAQSPQSASGGHSATVGPPSGEPIAAGLSETASGEPVSNRPIQTPGGPSIPNAGGSADAIGPPASSIPAPEKPAAVQAPEDPDEKLKNDIASIVEGPTPTDTKEIARQSFEVGSKVAQLKSARTGTVLAAHNAEMDRLQKEQAARDHEMQVQVQESVDRVKAKAQETLDAAPDASVVWGGQGTWSRAITTALASGLVGGPAVQSMMNATITMGMRDQTDKYNAARIALGNSELDYNAKHQALKDLDENYAAQRLAKVQSLAGAVAGIDNSVLPGEKKAQLLQTLAVTQQKFEDDDAKNAAMYAKAYKSLGGAGGGMGNGNMVTGFGADKLSAKELSKAVWIDPERKPLMYPDEASASAARKDIAAARTTAMMASHLKTFLGNYKGSWADLIHLAESPQGAWIHTTANYLVANEAHALGGRGMGMMNFLAGDTNDAPKYTLNSDAVRGSMDAVIGGTQQRVNDLLATSGFDEKSLRDNGIGIDLPQYSAANDESSSASHIAKVTQSKHAGGERRSPEELGSEAEQAEKILADENPLTRHTVGGTFRNHVVAEHDPAYQEGIKAMLAAANDRVIAAKRDLARAKGPKSIKEANDELTDANKAFQEIFMKGHFMPSFKYGMGKE